MICPESIKKIEGGLEVTNGDTVTIQNADEIEIEGNILVDGAGSLLCILGGGDELAIDGNILVDNGGLLVIDGAGGGDDDDSSIEGNIVVKRASSQVILFSIGLEGSLSTIQKPGVVSLE